MIMRACGDPPAAGHCYVEYKMRKPRLLHALGSSHTFLALISCKDVFTSQYAAYSLVKKQGLTLAKLSYQSTGRCNIFVNITTPPSYIIVRCWNIVNGLNVSKNRNPI